VREPSEKQSEGMHIEKLSFEEFDDSLPLDIARAKVRRLYFCLRILRGFLLNSHARSDAPNTWPQARTIRT
jgi:hypothetical protein